jgi:glucose-6-phosphate isomerase
VSDPRSDAWKALRGHAPATLAELFAADPDRVEKLSGRIELGELGVLFDWS